MAANSDVDPTAVQNHPVAAARQNHVAVAYNPEAAHILTRDQSDDKAAQVVGRILAEIRVAFARPADNLADNQGALAAEKPVVKVGGGAGMPARWAAHHRQAVAALATIEVEPVAGFAVAQVADSPGAMAQESKLRQLSPRLLLQMQILALRHQAGRPADAVAEARLEFLHAAWQPAPVVRQAW